MNTIRNTAEAIAELNSKGEELREALKQAIAALPENPKAKKISSNPRCFVVSSKDIFASKDNPTMRMDVFFHDFSKQYQTIIAIINRTKTKKLLDILGNIVIEGTVRIPTGETLRFHPAVIEHVAGLMKNIYED